MPSNSIEELQRDIEEALRARLGQDAGLVACVPYPEDGLAVWLSNNQGKRARITWEDGWYQMAIDGAPQASQPIPIVSGWPRYTSIGETVAATVDYIFLDD